MDSPTMDEKAAEWLRAYDAAFDTKAGLCRHGEPDPMMLSPENDDHYCCPICDDEIAEASEASGDE